jgi:hypothetical protein
MTVTDPTLTGLSDDLRRQLESWLVAFDRDWDEGRLASEAAKLPHDHPLRTAALAEMVKIDLERQWQRQAGRAWLEGYLRLPGTGHAADGGHRPVAAEYEATVGRRRALARGV